MLHTLVSLISQADPQTSADTFGEGIGPVAQPAQARSFDEILLIRDVLALERTIADGLERLLRGVEA